MWFGTPKLQKVQELVQLARRRAAKALPAETHQSYPVPVPGEKPLGVAFLYCLGRPTPKEGILLLPPSHRALLNAASGQVVQFAPTAPKDFGLDHPANELLGKYTMPRGMTAEEFRGEQSRLYQLYDLLMPSFAPRKTWVSVDLRKSAGQFRSLFVRLAEPPLLPYYRVLGRDFFSWLERIAR